MNDTVPVGTPDCELTAAVNVTGFPAGEGFRLEVSCTVVVALRTVTDSGAELLAALDWSPLYVAVSMCAPVRKDAVWSVASPLLTGDEPSATPPSLKITVPEGDVPVTVAARLRICPNLGLIGEAESVVTVATLFTVCTITGDVLP